MGRHGPIFVIAATSNKRAFASASGEREGLAMADICFAFFFFFHFFHFALLFHVSTFFFFFFSPHHGADIFSFFCFHTLPLCLTSACCKFCQAPLYAAGGAFSIGGGAVISFGAWSGNIGGLDVCLLLILLFFPHLQILITKQHLVAGK
ncbi:hypothetical protein IWX50DRAFT_144753 [Phyllosticta citricarpa]|uniref:Uncharacterized protein n=1 Tax=Phyllosticta citricarpa TaxID=55181 RepID=A0ABR1M6J6_9PEZI